MSDEHTPDAVERRLRAADPAARVDPPAGSWLPDLVEATMQSPTPLTARSVRQSMRPTRWIAVAAAASTVAAVGVGAYVIGAGDEPADTTAGTSVTLALPGADGGPTLGSCLPFSVDVLADMPVAFAGTATDVGNDRVVLEVDRWYRGGDADRVRLTAPDAATVSIDAVEFAEGERYLVTATDGVVNACGYTDKWSADKAAAFDEAFGAK